MVAVAGQRHEWKELCVQVVFDVEVPGEPGAGEVILVPGAIVLLSAN